MPPAISIENLHFSYGPSPILQNGTFQIEEGEYIGIIGPNGGGKSTLIKLLLALLQPKRGTIQIFGKPPREVREQIGYVPQSLNFDHQFPICVEELVLTGRLSHLSFFGRYQQADYDAAEATLELVGLKSLSKQPISALSGGQLQRALIARALVSDPKLLLLDEPTANLDTESEMAVFLLLRKLQKQGKTICMVNHDLNTIINEVTRVLVVQKKIFSLKPQEVCQHFAVGLYHSPLIEDSGEEKK